MMFFRGYNGIQPGCFLSAPDGWGMAGTWIFVALAVIAVIFIIVSASRNTKINRNNDIMQNLKTKYVNGEISEEEYLKRKEILEK